MKPIVWQISVLAFLLLVAGVFIAGCSDNTDSGTATTAATIATTPTPVEAKFSAGDIVRNPKSATTTTGLLIIGYDAATDTYERALIYPNSDGSWGYRVDAKTEKTSRATVEKTYTSKAGHVEVSSVPTSRPTTIATAAPTITSTVVATTTTTALYPPKVKDISPDKGATGSNISVTSLTGENFRSGATVFLKRSSATIAATNVKVQSSVLISCNFDIPTDAAIGYWSVVVKNSDGQSVQYDNGFYVSQGTATATTTTTTTSTSSAKVNLYSVSPAVLTIGGSEGFSNIMVTGTNLSAGSHIKLVSSTLTLTGTGYYLPNTQQAQDTFNFPANSQGMYTVQVVDSSGTVIGSLTNGFQVQ